MIVSFPCQSMNTYTLLKKRQIHTRLVTVHLARAPPGQVNRASPCQTLRQKLWKNRWALHCALKVNGRRLCWATGRSKFLSWGCFIRKAKLTLSRCSYSGCVSKSSLAGLSCQDSTYRRRGNSSGSWSPSYAVSLVQSGGLEFTASESLQEPMSRNKYSMQRLCYLIRNLYLDSATHTWYSCAIIS